MITLRENEIIHSFVRPNECFHSEVEFVSANHSICRSCHIHNPIYPNYQISKKFEEFFIALLIEREIWIEFFWYAKEKISGDFTLDENNIAQN